MYGMQLKQCSGGIYSQKCLYLKRYENIPAISYPTSLKKKIQPKESKYKDIMNIIMNTNEIENTTDINNETKSWFIKKSNKIY